MVVKSSTIIRIQFKTLKYKFYAKLIIAKFLKVSNNVRKVNLNFSKATMRLMV